MGLFGKLKSAVHIPPIIQKMNPVAGITHVVMHPTELIKNPISTISRITPITAIAHDAIKAVPISTIIEKAKEQAPLIGTTFHKMEELTKEIVKKSADITVGASKVVYNTGDKLVSKVEKGIVGVASIPIDMVKGVSHGVGGLFGDIKWIILGVVGITAVVIVMKGKELMEAFNKNK
jgi:hypothetical protein